MKRQDEENAREVWCESCDWSLPEQPFSLVDVGWVRQKAAAHARGNGHEAVVRSVKWTTYEGGTP